MTYSIIPNMKSIIKIFVTLLVTLLFFWITMTTLRGDCTENFSPSYIQIFPKNGTVPLEVTFAPYYIDSNSRFVVDFGDGSGYLGKNTNMFVHTYKHVGTYRGSITFITPTSVTQSFTIVVSQ